MGRKPKPDRSYDVHRERSAARQRELTTTGTNIGKPPAVVDPQRRAAGCASLRTFLETYLPKRFPLAWSPDHLQLIATTDHVVTNGGRHAEAMPRGSGKTTIAEGATLYAICSAKRNYVALLGATQPLALQTLESIKGELENNDLLFEDFPEICHPVRELNGQPNKCPRQHIDGERTLMVWSRDRIVLPTVAGSAAAAATIGVAGITGAIRGLRFRRPNGTIARPDLIIPDDIQTDRSARSASQCERRGQILNGTVMGLAGPTKKPAVLFPCTVIAKGDLADVTLDRAKSPEWTGRRYRLLYEFPKRMELWDAYSTLRADELRNDGDGSRATEFYRANKEAMDEGARVGWTERYNADEISALQGAMNLFYANKEAFWSEFQNEPLEENLGDGQLEAAALLTRVNGLERGVVPLRCSHVTAFVDVQQKVLFWLVAAWSDQFDGSVIDYGSWPDQSRRFFTAADVQRTIARAIPGAGLEGQIHGALTRCVEDLLGRTYYREDRVPFKIERTLVDAGYETDTVKNWARTFHLSALVMPSHGHAIGAKNKPWSEYDKARTEKMGLHWLIPKLSGKRSMRHVTFDPNFWKTFLCQRLQQAVGDRGALTLFGKKDTDHKMLVDHLTAEYWIETEGRGRKVHEWQMRPGRSENHWLDCLVGSAVAASMQGASLLGAEPPKRARVSWAELQAKAKEKMA